MVDKMVSREVARSDPQRASLSADVKALSLVDWWAEVAYKTQTNKIQHLSNFRRNLTDDLLGAQLAFCLVVGTA